MMALQITSIMTSVSMMVVFIVTPPASAFPVNSCTNDLYFVADDSSLCVFYHCVRGQPSIDNCPPGTRLPSYYNTSTATPCTIYVANSKCLRCDVNDTLPMPDVAYSVCSQWQGVCNPCACVDQDYGYYCDCPATATPTMPTPPNNPVPLCAVNVCLNGGTCQQLYDERPHCACAPGFTGAVCEHKLCDYNPCQNGGQCVSNGTALRCNCTRCYEGVCCEEKRTYDPDCNGCGPCQAGLDCSQVRTWLCACNPCPAGELCSNTELNTVRRCSKASGASSDKFTLMFEENYTFDNAALEMYATAGENDNIPRVVRAYAPWSTPDCSYDETQSITPGDVYKFNVPICLRHDYSGQLQNGIRVEEVNGRTITLYAINRATYSADSWLCLPDRAAGMHFIVVAYKGYQTYKSQFGIVAIYNDTNVTIVHSAPTDLADTTPGVPYTITLNACETYQVQAEFLQDLTGSMVLSDKPVHVVGGNVRAYVAPGPTNPLGAFSGQVSRDNLVEEIIPVEFWSDTYAVVPSLRTMIGYPSTEVLVRVLGHGTTQCSVYSSDLSAPSPIMATLTAPLYVWDLYVDATPNYFINCSQAVLVMMLTESARQQISVLDDPSLMYVPAISQYSNFYKFAPPIFSVTGGPYTYVLTQLAARAADYGAVVINGAPPALPHIKTWARLNVPSSPDVDNFPSLYGGVFYLSNSDTSDMRHNSYLVKFMCLVYAFDDRESIGHAAGTSLSVANAEIILTLP